MKTFSTQLVRRVYMTLAIVTVLSFVLWACQSKFTEPDEKLSSSISVVNGSLMFSNEEVFKQTLWGLKDKKIDLDTWEKQFPGFTSVRNAYKNFIHSNERLQEIPDSYSGFITFVGDGEDREVKRTVSDPLLATLVSKDGIFYIAKDAYRFTYEKFFIVRNQNARKLKEAASFTKTNLEQGIEVVPIIRKTFESTTRNLRTNEESINCLQSYSYNGSKRRLAGDIDYGVYYFGSFLYYTNVVVMTKHQSRVLGAWFTNNISQISVSGSIYNATTGVTVPFNETRSNEGYAEVSFPTTCQGIACDDRYKNISTTHSGNCQDNQTRSCTQYLP